MTNQARIQSIIEAFDLQYPAVAPLGMYCQFTGKRIGTSDVEDFDALCESIPGDPDDVADDIAMRLFASMRPSMRWNKMRVDSLNDLRKSAPVETMAYLLNRLYTPISHNREDFFSMMHDRILTYNWCQQVGGSPFADRLLYILLEIDARLDLKSQWPSFSLKQLLVTENFEATLEIVEAWHKDRLKAYAALMARMDSETKFWRSGHALAKSSFFNAFIESTPPTEATLKKQAKKAESAFMIDILSELMGKPDVKGEPRVAVPPKPSPVVMRSTKMPIRFGVKKLES